MANGIRKSTLVRRLRKNAVEVAPQQIQEALQRQFGQQARTLVDRTYLAAPHWLLRDILQYSGADEYHYRAEASDCDDFAYYLRGELPCKLGFNGVGVVLDYSAGHAYCAILTWRNGACTWRWWSRRTTRWSAPEARCTAWSAWRFTLGPNFK